MKINKSTSKKSNINLNITKRILISITWIIYFQISKIDLQAGIQCTYAQGKFSFEIETYVELQKLVNTMVTAGQVPLRKNI